MKVLYVQLAAIAVILFAGVAQLAYPGYYPQEHAALVVTVSFCAASIAFMAALWGLVEE